MGSCPEHPLWQGLHGKAEDHIKYLLHSSPRPQPHILCKQLPAVSTAFLLGKGERVISCPWLLWPTVKLCSATKDGLSREIDAAGTPPDLGWGWNC